MLHSENNHHDVVMMHGSVDYCVRRACCRTVHIRTHVHIL